MIAASVCMRVCVQSGELVTAIDLTLLIISTFVAASSDAAQSTSKPLVVCIASFCARRVLMYTSIYPANITIIMRYSCQN